MPHSTHHIHAEGFGYRYRVFSSPQSNRPTVFICNGFLQTMDSWVKYTHFFSKTAAVVIADLPGAGAADPIPEGQFDLHRLGRCIAAILEREGIAEIDVIAASYGAAIGYAFAQEHPERVRHLLLAGVMPGLDEGARRSIEEGIVHLRNKNMHSFAEKVRTLLMNERAECAIPRASIVRRLLYNQLVRLPVNLHQQFITNAYHLLRHPRLDISLDPDIRTLVVTGEFDSFTPPPYGREIARELPGSVFTVIHRADHLFHLEQTETTVELIDTFFRNGNLESVRGIGAVERFVRGGRDEAISKVASFARQ